MALATKPSAKAEKPIETHAAAIKYLETAAADLAGRKVNVTGTSPNVAVNTPFENGESGKIIIDISASASEPVLKISRFTFNEPTNRNYFAVAMRALCGIAYEKKCRILEFTNLGVPYVRGLLPYGAVPLTVPSTLEANMAANLGLPMVSRHFGIDEYTRLSLIQKRAYQQRHMAWVDLFMTAVTEPEEDITKVTVEKSEVFKRRMGVGTTMTVVVALRNAAQILSSEGPMPAFEAVAAKDKDPHYLASQLPMYHPPRLFAALDKR